MNEIEHFSELHRVKMIHFELRIPKPPQLQILPGITLKFHLLDDLEPERCFGNIKRMKKVFHSLAMKRGNIIQFFAVFLTSARFSILNLSLASASPSVQLPFSAFHCEWNTIWRSGKPKRKFLKCLNRLEKKTNRIKTTEWLFLGMGELKELNF